ncbi:MAG TPA: hypothetical protein VFW28_04370 [Micropepsaceae bacterium]|nr:hypothetical protein [Micropepsaceae bacterium]
MALAHMVPEEAIPRLLASPAAERRRVSTHSPVAPLTLPPQPPQPASNARILGAAALIGAVAALAGFALWRTFSRPRVQQQTPQAHQRAASRLSGAAAILSFSVLADSAMEHYRGAFQNAGMYVAPLTSAALLASSAHAVFRPERLGLAGKSLCGFALAIGTAGFGFHIYNIAKREGGIDWLNLFYGAPIGAPFALALAGLSGLAASRLLAQTGTGPALLGRPAGRVIAAGSAIALLGTAEEAALMHFRGAFQDPFMYAPVTIPVVAAAGLASTLVGPRMIGTARRLLEVTFALGLAGVGFHLFGISRNMGGFRNLSQNLLNGPPLPAPPSFTGVALAGLAGLQLMDGA